MGDLVPYAAERHLALVGVSQKTPEEQEEEQQQRLKEAEVLEQKLKIIQESVPTRIYNTCSSSAGAGSSDFHMYRMIRKAEQERWKRIEKMDAENKEKEAFETKRKQREAEADEKTAKNRAKRQKKKQKKAAKKASGGQQPTSGTGEDSGSDSDRGAGGGKEDVPEQADLD